MFEKGRARLADRLYSLVERFTKLHGRFRELEEEAKFSSRQFMEGADEASRFARLAADAELQAGFCGQAARQLLIGRALPIIFGGGVKRAEKFAERMEAAVLEWELGAAIGHAAFSKMMGNQGNKNAPNP